MCAHTKYVQKITRIAKIVAHRWKREEVFFGWNVGSIRRKGQFYP